MSAEISLLKSGQSMQVLARCCIARPPTGKAVGKKGLGEVEGEVVDAVKSLTKGVLGSKDDGEDERTGL